MKGLPQQVGLVHVDGRRGHKEAKTRAVLFLRRGIERAAPVAAREVDIDARHSEEALHAPLLPVGGRDLERR